MQRLEEEFALSGYGTSNGQGGGWLEVQRRNSQKEWGLKDHCKDPSFCLRELEVTEWFYAEG